jgi:CDGSH-type Zn-finger protein
MHCDKPWIGELEAGKYAICTCGKSGNDPFCDGAHKGYGKVPAIIEVTERKQFAFCLCGKTTNSPHCDGSHK